MGQTNLNHLLEHNEKNTQNITSVITPVEDSQAASNHKETAEKPKLKDIIQNNCFVIFRIVKVMKVKKVPRNYSREKVTKETWQVNAVYYPGLAPFAIKIVTGTTGET